jgi:hypothetical protein
LRVGSAVKGVLVTFVVSSVGGQCAMVSDAKRVSHINGERRIRF